MPLYQQQTTLQGRGHAPSVNYYAGIKAPVPAAPSIPKGEYKFNIDLQSIGNAMIQSSRDRKETELGLAKLEAAKQEKEQIAAEKQLKIDMSNALAQEISNVTDQLNQGLINDLTAARMQKSIKDKYRQYGVLNASEIYSTANAEDGGASTFLEKRREQYGNFEMGENNKVLSKMWEEIPSSRNLSNAETIAMHYKIEQAGARAAAAVVNNNNNSGTQELSTLNKQILMEDGLDAAVYQASTTLSNIATTSPSMSPSQQVQNAYENTFQYFKGLGSSDEVAMAAANSAMRRIKPYTDLIQNGSKEEKEFYQNKAATAKAQRALMMGQMFPAQLLASEYDKIDFSRWGVGYDTVSGKIIAPDISASYVNQYAPTSDGFVSQAVPSAITFPNGQTLPYTPETQWAVANQDKMLLAVVSGKVPVGEYIGRPAAVSVTNMASSQNVNARGPVPRGQENIIAQNSESFNRSINTATAQSNLKRQGEYDNVDYLGIIKSLDTSKASTVWSSDPEHWNQVYFEHGRPVQDSNFLFNYLRIAPDGSLMMTPTSGVINTFADIMAGRDFKNHINAINAETNGLDPQTRAAMIRRLVNKSNQGVLDANPDTDVQLSNKETLKETIGGAALDVGKYINNNLVNKKIVPAEEKVANWMQQEWFEPALKWYEEKSYNLIKAYDDWRIANQLEDNWRNRGLFMKGAAAEFVSTFAEKADETLNDLNQTTPELPQLSQVGLKDLLPQQGTSVTNTNSSEDLVKGLTNPAQVGLENFKIEPKEFKNIDEATTKIVDKIKPEENGVISAAVDALDQHNESLFAALRAGYTGDQKDIDELVKHYNRVGKEYGAIYQTFWLAVALNQFLAGNIASVLKGSAETLADWIINYDRLMVGNIETQSERASRKSRESIQRNIERYSDKYSGNDLLDFSKALLNRSPFNDTMQPIEFE